jgi:hypothetical protein
MKTSSVKIVVGTSLFAMFLVFAPAVQARERACSAAGVAGAWGYTNAGSIPARGAFAFVSVGRAVLDASGKASGNQTTSLNGAIFQETITGSFTVNADCTGTAVVNVFQGQTLVRTSLLDLVFVDNMNEARGIVLSAGTAIGVSLRRISIASDD